MRTKFLNNSRERVDPAKIQQTTQKYGLVAIRVKEVASTTKVCYLATSTYRASRDALSKIKVGTLSPTQAKEFWNLIYEFADVFAESKDQYGQTDAAEHEIIIEKDTRPIKQRPYRTTPEKHQFINEEVNRMKRTGAVKDSTSPWASPVVVVDKKTGDLRFCVDYRKLNNVTIKDAYPAPHIDDLLNELSESCFYSSLDLQSGYWQVPMAKKDQAKTAFVTRNGLFEFTVMPFGLTNAPQTFQRLMDTVLRDLLSTCVVVFVDDVNVHSKTWQQHLLDLRATFERLRKAGLRLNIAKCQFCQPELAFLGFITSSEGIKADPAKTQKMADFPRPNSVEGIRSFLGLLSFYRRFIPDFSTLAQPLNLLLKNGQPFRWGKRQEQAFLELKRLMMTTPILAYPDLSKPFILHTDASYQGFGAVLGQRGNDNKERVVAYASRSLNKHELNYAPTAIECAAVVWAVQHFHLYLSSQTFDVYTDHQALLGLMKKPQHKKRMFNNWIAELQQYKFKLHYRPGHQNRADCISRPGQ